ncbi:MAG: phosphate acyltransferase PlsX [Deltaproteobacteria bacterium]|nr:phosphate acyltransferase PlsX [Deltaproteobacteria bacterium]
MSEFSAAPVDVALDAMGGDHAPRVPVEAALLAVKEGLRIALVGDEAALGAELARHSASPSDALIIISAAEVIGMEESPARALRGKRGSSMRVAVRQVAEGRAAAAVSAGNTGAMMAVSLAVLGRLPHVQRPALAALIPTVREPLVVLDLGANVDPTPVQLAQFALIGEAYARVALGRRAPKVALLSNGTEAKKGTATLREASQILARAPIAYAGFCEGRDLFSGELDVVATDGFTGNVLLKTLEGFVGAVRHLLEEELRRHPLAALGALTLRPALRRMRRRLDHEEAGAAPLLGLAGPALVAHGASSVNALKNAILAAHRSAALPLGPAITEAMQRAASAGLWSEKG